MSNSPTNDSKYVDIQVVLDPEYFPNNNVSLSTDPMEVPVLNGTGGVWMICEQENVVSGQATAYSLHVKAKRAQTLRWWDAPLSINDQEMDMMIVGFCLNTDNETKWKSVFGNSTKADTRTVGIANIKSGFSLDTLADLKFGMQATQLNYITATVDENAAYGTVLQYYLIVAKLDVSKVGEPELKALYRIDPTISIYE